MPAHSVWFGYFRGPPIHIIQIFKIIYIFLFLFYFFRLFYHLEETRRAGDENNGTFTINQGRKERGGGGSQRRLREFPFYPI
jgi:hypothetical protein